MSLGFFAGALTAWAIAYVAVAVFFITAHVWARRDREYFVFGIVTLCLACMSAGIALMARETSDRAAELGSCFAITGALFACSFQIQFALRYTERATPRSVAAAHVVPVGVASWAWFAGHAAPARSPYLTPLPVFAESAALTIAFCAACLLGVLASLCLLWYGYRHGKSGALLLFGATVVVGAAAVHDAALLLTPGKSVTGLSTPHVLWVYVVAMAATLLVRYRGTEGRLRETAQSLRARTEELRRSHAELVKVQGELVRKEQLAAVGELAASIAHEVRNPLAIIVNATAGLRRRTLPENDRETLLSIIDEETERLNRLVAELLRFARPVTAKRALVSLVELCQEVQRSRPHGYDVVVSIPDQPELETIWVDPGLFRLVLDNLVSNACQSMRSGGTVTIDVHDAEFDDGRPAVAIDIVDAGHGMEPVVLSRATHPFFTTRPSGTGLGLPIVLRIVEAHGGDLRLRSEPGQGTTATLRIPRSSSGRASMPDMSTTDLSEITSKGSLRVV
jgi:signal transduction histidine kinase